MVIRDTFSEMKLLKEIKPDVAVQCEEWVKDKAEEMAFVNSYGGEVVILPYLEAEFMRNFKDKSRKMLEDKTKILCEECHKLI